MGSFGVDSSNPSARWYTSVDIYAVNCQLIRKME